MAKLSTQVIKEEISNKFNCLSKDIKRTSKKKNENKEVERTFEVNNQTIVVTSDKDDEKIISMVANTYSESSSTSSPHRVAASSKVNFNKPNFSDYYFAVSTQRFEGGACYLVSIISKKFWEENKHSDDQPSPLIDDLPEFISDLNESSEMAAYVEDWQDAYSELINLGFEYNNELALFLDEHFPGMHIQE